MAVFISYARADRPHVAPLAAALTAAGHDVWWDALIEGGAGFAKAIEEKLDSADAVIVVWSATSVNSDWVRDEAGHGRDRKRIVPLSLDGTEPPLGFRQYHTIDLTRWRGRADAPEMAAVLTAVAAAARGAPVARDTAKAGGLSRRTVVAVGGGALAVAAAGGIAFWQPWRGARVDSSVAVLPFANLSGDPTQAWFSDGLSEEIRSALARNPQLKVAAPTSANTFRDRTADAKAIGAKLGVAYLLEGSVRRAGDVVRVAAELIETATGFSKLSQSFDRKLTDVFAVQSEIAAIVVEAMAVRVAGPPKAAGSTTDVVAYDAFLKGRAFFNADVDEASDRAALTSFDAAIAADPDYAAAHAGRSRILSVIASQYAEGEELRTLFDAAISAGRRAVALAPDLAAAQLALGDALYGGHFDIRGARDPYNKAAKLGAGEADILVLFAIYCSRTGRAAEAIAAVTRAMELDRLNPRAFRAGGLVSYGARQYATAIPLSQQALTLSPSLRNARANIGNCLLMLGRFDEARAAYVAEPLALLRLPGLAMVEHHLGRAAEAKAAMNTLIAELGDAALYQQAQVLAQWGLADQAFATLERARSAGDSGLLMTLVDPLLDPLRPDARYSRLLKGLGLA